MRSLLLALVVFSLGATSALACSCRPYQSAAEEVANVDALFRGRVVETRPDGNGWSITTFEVLTPLKMPAGTGSRVEVRHYAGSTASCGIEFELGATPLVGAQGIRGDLVTNFCGIPRFTEAAYRAALGLPPA